MATLARPLVLYRSISASLYIYSTPSKASRDPATATNQPLGGFPITSRYGAGRSRTESELALAAAVPQICRSTWLKISWLRYC